MFHENVKKSAWGLAIHSKSRLIAVSTNIHEITVFVFATRSKFGDVEDEEELVAIEAAARWHKDLFPRRAFTPRSPVEDRQTGYRIVFPLRTRGENIPTVAFTSDATGEAAMVLAGDTAGRLVSYLCLGLCLSLLISFPSG
jgi:hypothetical protein